MLKKIIGTFMIGMLILFTTLVSTSLVAHANDKIVIGMAMIDLNSPFFISMMKAGNEAAQDYDVEVIWKSAEGSLENQIAIIENFIQTGVNVLSIDPLDKEAVKPVIEKAHKAGIHVITMGNFTDTPWNINTLYNDYNDMKKITEMAAAWLNYSGNVVFLNMQPGNYVSDERQKGFEDAVAQFEGIKVLSIQPAGWDPVKAMNIMENWLIAYDRIDAFISATDPNTLAAIEAIKAAGREKEIAVFSYDGDPEALEAVKRGDILIDLLTGSTRVGYWNVKVAAELARGKKFDQKVYLPTHFVMNEETAASLKEKGYNVDKELHSWVTPDGALELFYGYREELGPQ